MKPGDGAESVGNHRAGAVFAVYDPAGGSGGVQRKWTDGPDKGGGAAIYGISQEKRETKAAKPQKEKKEPEKGEASVKGGALALVKEFLPLAADAAGRVKRTIRIDRFYLDLTMAAGDPALAAMSFGGANAVLGMLWPPIEQNFNVKDWRLRTAVDFQLQAPVVWLQAVATLSVGQMVSLGAHLGIRAVRILWARQAAERVEASVRSTQKEAV